MRGAQAPFSVRVMEGWEMFDTGRFIIGLLAIGVVLYSLNVLCMGVYLIGKPREPVTPGWYLIGAGFHISCIILALVAIGWL